MNVSQVPKFEQNLESTKWEISAQNFLSQPFFKNVTSLFLGHCFLKMFECLNHFETEEFVVVRELNPILYSL